MVDVINNVNGSIIVSTADTRNNKSTSVNKQEDNNSIFSNPNVNQDNTTDFENLTLSSKSSFNNLKNYLNNGHNAKETYNYLVDSLKANKDNPEYVQKVVDNILGNISTMYDLNVPHKPIADTNEEVLEKFLQNNRNTPLDGAICSTMHGLLRDVLDDAGIPAVLLASKSYTDLRNKTEENSGGHATILYKMGDNKYVHTNYGRSEVIEADNIRSAIKKMFKESNELTAEGSYILITGKGGRTYDEYLFQKESAYGKDIEKSNHVKETAFMGNVVKDKSSLDFNISYDKKTKADNVEAQGTIAIPNKNVSIDLGMAYKSSEETDLMLNSKSYGAMFDINYKKDFGKDNNQTFNLDFDSKFVSIQGETKQNNYNTSVIKGEFNLGYENKFFENDTTKLTAGVKAGIVGGGVPNIKHGLGDYRFSTEAGLAIENQFGSIGKLNTEVSAGFIGDIRKLNYTYQDIGMAPGFKANVKTALTLGRPNKALGMLNAEGYYVKTDTVEHYGASAGIGGSYKATDNITAFGALHIDYNKKDIDVGQFKETLDNNLKLSANVGAKFANQSSLNLNFQEDLRKKDMFFGVNVKKEF